MRSPDVTICIPAWQAEAFIDETLWCARHQTHEAIRILVSVDLSEDRTVEICRAHARDDPRVEVVAQAERLGWAGNVNFLLAHVATEYFFIYFHDDFIDPTYTECLLRRIRERPDAAGAQCGVLSVNPDGRRFLSKGHDHLGSASDRIVACLLDPRRGETLRALMRRDVVRELRYPAPSRMSFLANLPYLVQVFGAGPVVCVPQVLYWRVDRRAGGLVEGWLQASVDDVIADQPANVRACLSVIRQVPVSGEAQRVLEFALQIAVMRRVRDFEYRRGARQLAKPRDISSAFRFDEPPAETVGLTPGARRLIWEAYRELALRELRCHVSGGRIGEAARTARAFGFWHVAVGLPGVSRRLLQRALQQLRGPDLPGFLRRRLNAEKTL